MLDAFLFVIVLLLIYYCLNDVIGQFLYCCFLVGVLMNLSYFVTFPVGLTGLYQLILSVLIFCSLGKFYWMVKKKNERTKSGESESIFDGES